MHTFQPALRTHSIAESVIREMTRLAMEHQAINLAQGFPDFPTYEDIKQSAITAIQENKNQYPVTWGNKSFREAIAAKTKWYLGVDYNPDTDITVCCGSTEAMMAAMLATVNPGDEVILFEPLYENYKPDIAICGAVPKTVKLYPPYFNFNPDELQAAFNNKTKAIIICTPNNPTGKVFGREELEQIAQLCIKWDVIAITDEIYEHILYDGTEHIAICSLEGMQDRTITINSLSKTYAVTGWRVGYAIANQHISNALRKMHDYLTVGAPTPLQEAGAYALSKPKSYYTDLAEFYKVKRDKLTSLLTTAGFQCFHVYGAYYILTDISNFGFKNDLDFVHFLIKEIGVAAVPGSSFFINPEDGKNYMRFCFAKKEETLERAGEKLLQLKVSC